MANPMDLHALLIEARKRWVVGQHGITAVYVGFKRTKGVRTDTRGIIIGVKEKLAPGRIPAGQAVPAQWEGVTMDVVEANVKALELNTRIRPAPGGYSVGHPDITAGTLGAWVERNGEMCILSNNHVLSNSNNASPGDEILQPGAYDGGKRMVDRIASLTDFVTIKFDGAVPEPPKKRIAIRFWSAWLSLPNAIAKRRRCPYRAKVHRLAIGQSENLVDAAVAKATDPSVIDPEIALIGPVKGIRDLVLGDKVHKTGRTTSHTEGYVEGVGASIQVSYGDQGVATFVDQVIIRSDSGEFSAGGDSGSAILTEDGYLAGLLFAGGDGMTIANRIGNVVALLGVRVEAKGY